MEYQVNRGVGQPVEFMGLRSQYLFIVAGGLVGCFLLVVVLNLVGVSTLISAGVAFGLATVIVYGVGRINRTYGPYGLMKLSARRHHPDYLSNRVRVNHLVRHEKYE